MGYLIHFILIVFCASFAAAQQKPAPLDVGTRDCLCPVTANIDYICGSNGSTYSNPSAMGCAVTCTNKKITKVHRGQCP